MQYCTHPIVPETLFIRLIRIRVVSAAIGRLVGAGKGSNRLKPAAVGFISSVDELRGSGAVGGKPAPDLKLKRNRVVPMDVGKRGEEVWFQLVGWIMRYGPFWMCRRRPSW